jgi:hypothetical protein
MPYRGGRSRQLMQAGDNAARVAEFVHGGANCFI